jgi:hypothetical protein
MPDTAINFKEALKARDDFESKLIMKAWENEEFRKEFLANPRKVLAKEFGHEVPASINVEVVEETGNKICFVLPRKPTTITADGVLSDEALEDVAAGFCLIYQGAHPIIGSDGDIVGTVGAKWFVIM